MTDKILQDCREHLLEGRLKAAKNELKKLSAYWTQTNGPTDINWEKAAPVVAEVLAVQKTWAEGKNDPSKKAKGAKALAEAQASAMARLKNRR